MRLGELGGFYMPGKTLKDMKGDLGTLSNKELEEVLAQARDEAEKRRVEPLETEKAELEQKIKNLNEQLVEAEDRLDLVLSELGLERSKTGYRPKKKSGEMGCRKGSLRWYMIQAAKNQKFPELFTMDEIFESVRGKVKTKSDESLRRQVVATLSRCPEFKNVRRGRGAKKGSWRLEL